MVVGHQGEDDHGDEVGNYADVKGDGSKPLPFGPQELIDGLHCQHLKAVLTAGPYKHKSKTDAPLRTHVLYKSARNYNIVLFTSVPLL